MDDRDDNRNRPNTYSDFVVGVGSPHGDDQIGWLLIDWLQARTPALARLRAVGDPVDILEDLDAVTRLVLVDGCHAGALPGTIHRWDWCELQHGEPQLRSTHHVSLLNALRLADILGRLPDHVILLGVEISACQPQTNVSPAVTQALPGLADRVAAELSATR